MAESKGIKETTEVIVAFGDAAILVGGAIKTCGKDPKAIAEYIAAELMKTPATIDDFKAAFEGIREVPAEVKDLSLSEIMQLSRTTFDTVTRAVGVLA